MARKGLQPTNQVMINRILADANLYEKARLQIPQLCQCACPDCMPQKRTFASYNGAYVMREGRKRHLVNHLHLDQFQAAHPHAQELTVAEAEAYVLTLFEQASFQPVAV